MQATGKEKIPRIISESSAIQGSVQGKIVIDSAVVKAANEWSAQLTKINLVYESMIVNNEPRQADIVVKDKQWRLRIATDGNAADTIGYVDKALKKIAADGKDMNEYLDVRIPYRIFYK
jgi:hypothetical protein